MSEWSGCALLGAFEAQHVVVLQALELDLVRECEASHLDLGAKHFLARANVIENPGFGFARDAIEETTLPLHLVGHAVPAVLFAVALGFPEAAPAALGIDGALRSTAAHVHPLPGGFRALLY